MSKRAANQLLFSYGTLRQPDVQIALFGRTLNGEADAMMGWHRRMIEVSDPDVIAKSGTRWHPLVEPSADADDRVEGVVLHLCAQDLAHADAYEVDYCRQQVRLASGRLAWFYGARA